MGLRSFLGAVKDTADVTEDEGDDDLDLERDLDLSLLRPRDLCDLRGEGLRLERGDLSRDGVGGGGERSLSFSLERDLLRLVYRFLGGGVGLLVFSLMTGEGGGVLSLLPDSISSSFCRLAQVLAR